MVNHLLETRHPLSSSALRRRLPRPGRGVPVADPSSIFRTHFQVPYPASPFVRHSYENTGGVGVFFPFWDLSPSLARSHAFLDHLAKSRSSSAPLISFTVTSDDSINTHLSARDKIMLRVNQESPSVRRAIIAFVLIYSTAGLSASAQSTDSASTTPQTSPAPAPCSANCPQTPAKPATATPDSPAKPPAKPHKVLTNDDIDARPHDVTITGGRDILQQLNTCDRTCFDQVAQRAGVNGGYTARWKLALLDAIEAVKRDADWQGNLGEILGVQGQACETQVRKTEDLRKYADSRNITPSELAVERQYEPKFREIRARLNAALDRANAHIAKVAPDNLQAQYMHMQVDKLVHATCTINVPPPPEDTDDPPDP